MPPVRFLLGVMKWRPCEGRIVANEFADMIRPYFFIVANEFADMIRPYVISVIITTDSPVP